MFIKNQKLFSWNDTALSQPGILALMQYCLIENPLSDFLVYKDILAVFLKSML